MRGDIAGIRAVFVRKPHLCDVCKDGGERWPHDLCRWTQESVCVQEWVQQRSREDAGGPQHPRAMRPIGDVSWTSRAETAPDLGEILASLVSGFVPRGRMDVVGHQRGGAAWGSWPGAAYKNEV